MPSEIEVVVDARTESIGAFSVRRSLPTVRRRMVGPFTFLDHMGPVPAGGASLDVLPHPHIGLATLTYLFAGEVVHRDTLGNTQPIVPGEVNWMIAGRGIAHSERVDVARASSPRMHGIQAWIALPEEHEETEPAFGHFGRDELPLISDTGVEARLLSGSAYGQACTARTFSPQFYVAVRLSRGARIALPPEHEERAAYIVSGEVTFGGERYTEAQLVVAAKGGEPVIAAHADAVLMLLGGAPLGRRHMWWNFVSSRKERIEQAKADWAAGRIALPPDDGSEWIPLPPDRRPKPAPEPMS